MNFLFSKLNNKKKLFNRYDCVTLMFSGIVGFGQYCAANTDAEGAMKIVKMLNELYTVFDAVNLIFNFFLSETQRK